MVDISESTVRNAVMYDHAAEMRNRYVPPMDLSDDYLRVISGLGVRQVRAYVELPEAVRDVWLDAGADLKMLEQASLVTVTDPATGKAEKVYFSHEGEQDCWAELAEAGLAIFIRRTDFVSSDA